MVDATEDVVSRLGSVLDSVPADAGADMIADAVEDAQSRLPWSRLHHVLLERVAHNDTPRDRIALVLHSVDPDVAGSARGKRDLASVFEVLVAAADARALDLFLLRARALLDDLPAVHGDLPTVSRLLEISDQITAKHEDTADHLVTLAQVIEDLEEAAREAEEAQASADV